MSEKSKKCLRCKVDITGTHANTKRCKPCIAILRKRPLGTLTKKQIVIATSLADKMKFADVAKHLGVSKANLKRSLDSSKVKFTFHNKHKNNPSLVSKVCAYYEKHGKRETQKKFPEVRVRSIVERYPFYKPRQSRWASKEIIEAVKMAGLVSYKAQWLYFKRPLAFEGSICSLWMKKFGFGQGKVNGLRFYRGRHFVKPRCKPVTIKFGELRNQRQDKEARIYLWVDLEKHLLPNVNEDFKIAIQTMARFQKWLWKSENPRTKILNMIKQREILKNER